MEQKKEILLSLVITAYNVEAYAHACIRSVLAAGCKEVEVVIVLGGSFDRTNEICRSYAGKNVKCIMQDGSGLSNARNCGILACRGTYVAFLDADDRVSPGAFARFCVFLSEVSRQRDFDALVNDFYFADADGKMLLLSRQIAAAETEVLDAAYARRLVCAGGTFWNVWRYVYKRGYLLEKQRRFAEGRCCEDLDFTVRTFLGGAKLLYCHMPYYRYCPVRPGSLMNAKDWKMIRDFLVTVWELLKLCQETEKPGETDGQKLAQDIAEKLKGLAVLTLPDIYEVPKKDRKKSVCGYRKLFLECPQPQGRILRLLFPLCCTRAIWAVGFLLSQLKKIRRKIRYRMPKNSKNRRNRKSCRIKY